MENSKLQQLKDVITLVLEDCDTIDYPHVCNMASDPDTRKYLEAEIINMAKQGINVQSAIIQIERAFNSNMMED